MPTIKTPKSRCRRTLRSGQLPVGLTKHVVTGLMTAVGRRRTRAIELHRQDHQGCRGGPLGGVRGQVSGVMLERLRGPQQRAAQPAGFSGGWGPHPAPRTSCRQNPRRALLRRRESSGKRPFGHPPALPDLITRGRGCGGVHRSYACAAAWIEVPSSCAARAAQTASMSMVLARSTTSSRCRVSATVPRQADDVLAGRQVWQVERCQPLYRLKPRLGDGADEAGQVRRLPPLGDRSGMRSGCRRRTSCSDARSRTRAPTRCSLRRTLAGGRLRFQTRPARSAARAGRRSRRTPTNGSPRGRCPGGRGDCCANPPPW